MNKYISAILVAAVLALGAPDAHATYKTCPDGSRIEYNKTCPEPPKPEPKPQPGDRDWWQQVSQQQNQTQTQNNNQNQSIKDSGNSSSNSSAHIKDSGNSSNTNSNTAHGGSSSIKDSGNSTAVASGGSSNSTATGGSSTIKDVGNTTIGDVGSTSSVGNVSSGSSIGDTTNTNRNSTNIGDVGSTSLSNATGGSVGNTTAQVGDTSATGGNVGDVGNNSGNSTNTLANNSNSGGNTLSNGSESTSRSNSGGNTMTGGDNNASADGSGNSRTDVSIDASDRSSTSYVAQTLLLPTIQTAAPALVANPTLVVDRGVCGPRMDKVQGRVDGTYVGIVKKSKIDLGVDDELVPAAEPYRYWTAPNGTLHVFGHQVITYASVVGVAASRSIGLGGGETGGNWGQGGVSSGSSMQRNVLRVQLQECEIQLAPREVPVLIEVPRKRQGG